MPDTTPAIGHNRPPADEALEALRNRVDHLAEIGRKWDAERPRIADDDQAKKASTFVAQLRDVLDRIDAARKDEKAPHIHAGKAVDEKWKPLAALLEPIRGAMGRKMTDWQVERDRKAGEARRKAEEEAAKRQAEADKLRAKAETVEEQERAAEAQRAADGERDKAKSIDSRTRSDTGQTTYLKKDWKFEFTDPAKVPRCLCEPHPAHVRNALTVFDDVAARVAAGDMTQLEATAALKKHGFQGGRREINGVRIWEQKTAVTRNT